MKAALFDPYSGASGDMVLGAFVDAGMPVEHLRSILSELPVSGYDISSIEVNSHAVRGTRVTVDVTELQPARSWAAINEIIAASTLPPKVQQISLAIFEALALAEAKVHGEPVESIHFHEVGAVDAIIDICGAAIGLDYLAIDELYSLPIRTGSGFVNSQHGVLPVPAPATAQLLANASAPLLPAVNGLDPMPGELLTPTGAAILTTLARFDPPVLASGSVSYGFGTRELPWANALRLWIADIPDKTESSPDSGGTVLIETTIDDMSPQGCEILAERLYAGGAREVWITPVMMKKFRPGFVVSAISDADGHSRLVSIMLANSTSLGVRSTAIERTVLERKIVVIGSRFGDIRLKLKIVDGRVASTMPEYDDCLQAARRFDRTFQDVWTDAHRLGDQFIGQDAQTIADFDPSSINQS
ncbi:nickel pincer cofactor biosynthesis protein LarC [soil metagenome]